MVNYYDTIFRREREKTTQLRALLPKYGPQVQQLHERGLRNATAK